MFERLLVLLACVYGYQSLGIIESTTIGATIEPCAETPECLTEADKYTFKPYPPDCSKYIYCDENLIPILSDCPNDKLFSPTLLMCTKPDLSDCSNCTTLPIGPCPETPTCGQNDTGLLKPYPADCSLFIYCGEPGDGELRTCPAGQHFNPSLSMCLSAEVANCPVCNPGTTPIPSPGVCPEVPTCHIKGKLLPYPPDCTKYLYCEGFGQADLSSCPFRLHFSPVTFTCEDPEDAMCPLCWEASTTATTRFTLKSTTVVPASSTINMKPTTAGTGHSTITLKPSTDVTEPSTVTLKPPTTDATNPSSITLKSSTLVTAPSTITQKSTTDVIEHTTMTLKPTSEITQNSEITLKPTTEVTNPSTITLKSSTEVSKHSTMTLKPTSEITENSAITLKPTTEVTKPSTITLKSSTEVSKHSTMTLKPTSEITQNSEITLKPTTEVTNPSTITLKSSTEVSKHSTMTLKPTSEVTGSSKITLKPTTEVTVPSTVTLKLSTELTGVYTITLKPTTEVTGPSTITLKPTTDVVDLSTITIKTTPTVLPNCAETPDCHNLSDMFAIKPYPPDCGRYIYCDEYLTPNLRYCPYDYLFSPTSLYCIEPALSDCPICTVPTIGPCPEIPTCGETEMGLVKPYPPDCSMYIYCDNADEILSHCQIGEHFNPVELRCMDPEDAKCSLCLDVSTAETTRFTLKPTSEISGPSTVTVKSTSEVTRPSAITLKPTIDITGPSTLTLKPTIDVSGPSTGTLKPTSEVTGPSTITLKPTIDFSGSSTVTLKPTSEVTEISTVTLKPTSEISDRPTVSLKPTSEVPEASTITLNPTTKVNVSSTNSMKPTTKINAPSTITLKPSTDFTKPSTVTLKPILELCPETPTCYPNYTDVLLPFPPNCSQYINCNGTTKILGDCPSGQHFSPLESMCMPPEEANCPLCLEASTTEPPIPTTTLPPCPPEQSCKGQPNNARLPFPMDCTMYKRCRHGQEDYWMCPLGKEFSPTTSWCEFPDVANCTSCDCPGCTYPPNFGNDTVGTFLSDSAVLSASHYLVQGIEDVMIDDMNDFFHEDE